MAFSISRYIDPIPFSNIVASLPYPLSKRIIFQLPTCLGVDFCLQCYLPSSIFQYQKKNSPLPSCPIHCGRLDLHQMDPSNLKIRSLPRRDGNRWWHPDDGASRTVDDSSIKKQVDIYIYISIYTENHKWKYSNKTLRTIGGKKMRDGFWGKCSGCLRLAP